MKDDEKTALLQSLAGIFLRCFFLSYALLLLWFVLYVAAGDWIYSLHTHWFEMGRSAFDSIHYCGMALVKICAILFFLFPYLAIKLVLRKEREVR
jgi:hypothetical protein